jgi:hypothetical protein
MFRNLFNLKGINFWLLGMALVLNLVWAILMLSVTNLLTNNDQPPEWLDLAVILAGFLGPLVIAFAIGKMSFDRRGPTYGVIGSLGGAALLGIFVLVFANWQVGFITTAVAIMGGLQGGLLSQRHE